MIMKKCLSYCLVVFGLLAIFSCQDDEEVILTTPDARFLVKLVNIHYVAEDESYTNECTYDNLYRITSVFLSEFDESSKFDYVNPNEIIETYTRSGKQEWKGTMTLKNGRVVSSIRDTGTTTKYVYNDENQLIESYYDDEIINEYQWSDGNRVRDAADYLGVVMLFEYNAVPATINYNFMSFFDMGFYGVRSKNLMSRMNFVDSTTTTTFSYELDDLGRPAIAKEYVNGVLSIIYTFSYLKD